MPNNGTIAVWCVPRAGSTPTEIEAHFNYWRLAGDKAFKRKSPKAVVDFVEVGLMVTDIAQVESVSIYVPVTVSRGSVADCAPYLADAEFAQGIFNEVLAVTTPAAGGPHCVVLLRDRDIFCRVHSFPVGQNGIESSELEITAENGGSVLTITAAAIREACLHLAPPAPVYFRLRLYLKEGRDENPFVKVIQPRDRLFQSGFDEIEYIDFRMNEARTLPIPIEHRMRLDRSRGAPIDFKLVAFLTAVPVRSELSVSNTPSHKMRLLEGSWNGYVESGMPEGMVVYHWKRVPEPAKPITDFSAFVKLQTRRSSVPILLKYLAIAFVFGLAGNLTASWLSGVWDRAFSRRPETAAPPALKSAPQTKPVSTAAKPPPLAQRAKIR